MPTDTFFRLDEEKKEKIILAAKKEFSEVSIQEASVANIIKYADIPRGSFYQYFSDKDDIFFYVFSLIKAEPESKFIEILTINEGDLFKSFKLFFSYYLLEVFEGENRDLFKNIFQHINYTRSHQMMMSGSSDKQKKAHESHFRKHHQGPNNIYIKLKECVDQSELQVSNDREFMMLIHQLWSMLFHTMNEGFRMKAFGKEVDLKLLQSDFELKLNWLENGVKK